MARIAQALLLLILLLMPLSQVVATGESSETRSVNLTVAAIVEDTNTGVLVGLQVIVSPGTGQVKIEASKVGDTTRYSMIQAVVTGAVLAGSDWRLHDYTIRFINASNVEGPSASAAVATAVYLLLLGSPLISKLSNSTVITGAITPLGLYSAVGGIPEKCMAAEEAGKLFIYPAANYIPSIPGCNGENVSVAGILGAVEALEGVHTYTKAPSISMPEEFMKSMRNASRYMTNVTLNVLNALKSEGVVLNDSNTYIDVLKLLNESNATLDDKPYVSASKAFTALYTAFYLYYLSKTSGSTEGLADFVAREAGVLRENLTMLEENLTRLPNNGSAYYVEFLGTAYARIADALSELESVEVLATTNPMEALRVLAYARARIYSVESWVWTAQKVRDLEPKLNSSMIRTLASVAGDFVHISADYSASIARYMMKAYNKTVDKKLLQAGLEALAMIMNRGDTYLSSGNYIAALGFYREALSRSMNTVFSVIISNFTDVRKIYMMYYNETTRLYSKLAAGLVWEGFPPGLAPAYMEYAQYEFSKGDLVGAVDLARSALASTMIWKLVSVSRVSRLMPTEEEGFLQGVVGPGHGVSVVALVSGIAGFLVALIVLGSLYRRSLERVATA
ncbi:MAG: hypothetical protein F7C34_05335 [Desulfurococcales archaeon]|nr:hypothetical protein [Desulfurococcales archaeon]